jgi:hypothetical protein
MNEWRKIEGNDGMQWMKRIDYIWLLRTWSTCWMIEACNLLQTINQHRTHRTTIVEPSINHHAIQYKHAIQHNTAQNNVCDGVTDEGGRCGEKRRMKSWNREGFFFFFSKIWSSSWSRGISWIIIIHIHSAAVQLRNNTHTHNECLLSSSSKWMDSADHTKKSMLVNDEWWRGSTAEFYPPKNMQCVRKF